MCDVMTGFTIHGTIETTEIGERKLAMEHLHYFESLKQEKDIVLFDRGYASKAMIKYLDESGFKYVMRLQRGFNAEIDSSNKSEFYVYIDGKCVRVIKIVLPTGETEVLITNLGRKAFKTKDFMALYHLRWGIETKYNTLKNKFDIETFSGKTIATIMQDFYATLFLSNVATAIKCESDAIIRTEDAEKSNKHEYIANENILIGKLKDKLVMILLIDDPGKRSILLDKLILQMTRYKTAVVPDRHFTRPAASHKRSCQKPKKAL